MKSSVVVLMTLAVFGFSGAAFAQATKQPAAMSDAEMDKVTAGATGGIHGPNLDNFGQSIVRPDARDGGVGRGGTGGNCPNC